MPQTYLEQLEQLDKPWFYRVAVIGGTLLFVLAALLWWNVASVQPARVFWGAINNNLVTTGLTKQTTTLEEGGSLQEQQQISLGAQNVVSTTATIEQTQADGPETTVVTETIATPQVNFARYTHIETSQKAGNDQPFDFAPALNQWSKHDVPPQGSGAFSEALFGLVPVAYLPGSQRQQIMADMKNNNVYDIDYGQVNKRRENGRLIYTYTVLVNPEQYLASLKQIDAAMGLNQMGELDPSQYAGSGAVQIQVSIDAHAKQLTNITYGQGERSESYSGYGIFRQVSLPENTIPQADLQTKLNQILDVQ